MIGPYILIYVYSRGSDHELFLEQDCSLAMDRSSNEINCIPVARRIDHLDLSLIKLIEDLEETTLFFFYFILLTSWKRDHSSHAIKLSWLTHLFLVFEWKYINQLNPITRDTSCSPEAWVISILLT